MRSISYIILTIWCPPLSVFGCSTTNMAGRINSLLMFKVIDSNPHNLVNRSESSRRSLNSKEREKLINNSVKILKNFLFHTKIKLAYYLLKWLIYPATQSDIFFTYPTNDGNYWIWKLWRQMDWEKMQKSRSCHNFITPFTAFAMKIPFRRQPAQGEDHCRPI